MKLSFAKTVLLLGSAHFITAKPLLAAPIGTTAIGASATLSGPVVQTQVAASVGTLGLAAPAYDTTCNPENSIAWSDAWNCWMYLHNLGNKPCVANPSAQFCSSGGVKISGTSLHGGTVQASCLMVANGLSQIWEKCKSTQLGQTSYFGGSAATQGNGDLIVHAQPFWVTVT